MTHIHLENVALDYPIYGPAALSLRANILRPAIGGRINRAEHDVIVTRALENISLDVSEGERIGIIGANGAGKSTLLRVIAGIYQPSSGVVRTEGRIRTLFDIALGLEHEATGRENILMRGLCLGASAREVKQKIDDIIEFTELGEYIDMPLRTYSSGMQLRLAFAASTAFGADIILMDEIFGVGDNRFFTKAKERLIRYVGDSGIVVLATHSTDLLKDMCSKAVWIDHGTIRKVGDCEDVLSSYIRDSEKD